MTPKAPPGATPALSTRIDDLLGKASGGDLAALQSLKQELPQCEEILQATYGGLSIRIQEVLINDHAGVDKLEAEGLRLRVAGLKTELADPTASPLEKIVIERIACTWLHAHLCDLALAQYRGEYHHRARLQKVQAEADRRLFRACRALAQVRKLLTHTPAIHTETGLDTRSLHPTSGTAKRDQHQVGEAEQTQHQNRKAKQPQERANAAGVDRLDLLDGSADKND